MTPIKLYWGFENGHVKSMYKSIHKYRKENTRRSKKK